MTCGDSQRARGHLGAATLLGALGTLSFWDPAVGMGEGEGVLPPEDWATSSRAEVNAVTEVGSEAKRRNPESGLLSGLCFRSSGVLIPPQDRGKGPGKERGQEKMWGWGVMEST